MRVWPRLWTFALVFSVFLFVVFVIHEYRYCLLSPTHDMPDKFLLRSATVSYNGGVPSKGKILFMTASYTLNQFQYLWKVIEGYRDICEAGWDVDISLQVANGINASSIYGRQLHQSAFCYRTQRHLNITYQAFGDIGFGLNSQHRKVIQSYLYEYDYFLYSEEDMYFSPHHLQAFLQEEQKLKLWFPNSWYNYTIGYLRYEIENTTQTHVSWEYMPDKIHVVKLDPEASLFPSQSSSSNAGYYVVTNNLNQAFYIMGRQQMIYLEEKCEFLSKPGRTKFLQELRKFE